MKRGHKQQLKTGDEFNVIEARHVYKNSASAKIKRGLRRRERHETKLKLKEMI